MKRPLRNAVITILLGLAAGVAGMWIGHQVFSTPPDRSMHAMLHRELTLTAAQDSQIEQIEAAFATRRNALENEMREANAELAKAIRNSDQAGPEVEAAVHHFHDAMGELQTATIEHIFAMRQVLTPEQRATFDEKIGQALTSGAE